MDYIRNIAKRAKESQVYLRLSSSSKKNKILLRSANLLRENSEKIIQANKKDIELAMKKGAKSSTIDRLKLDSKRIESMAISLEEIASLPDPVGEISHMKRRPNGLLVGRMRIPLGVIGVIYESRPNVTSDVAGLCIKSGNSVILRGGSESLNSNKEIANLIRLSLSEEGVPEDCVVLIEDTSRELIVDLLKQEDLIDLIIPRGGEELIRFVSENSRIPVVKHFKGVCHIFVDKYADMEKALKICLNAKVQRPSVCNAMETLLVDKDISEEFLTKMSELYRQNNVEIRGCERTRKIIPWAKEATEDDWYAEYLDLILSVKVVDGIDEAMEHIRKYGSSHTEAIITENWSNAMKFINNVDSSTVLVNASTRFSDGYEFGLGAEVGISTSKIHAYGPMGLEGLTTLKFVVFGEGQIRT